MRNLSDEPLDADLPQPEAGAWHALEASLHERFTVVEQTLLAAGREFRLLKPRSPDELISEDDFNRDERLPYWADVWPSALSLAARLAGERGGGRRLLELGCGAGYVSAVAASRGFEVVASDYYAEALEFTRLNCWLNRLPSPGTRLVDWRELPGDLGRFDFVVGADVLYEKAYPALVSAAFAATLAPGGLGLVADPGRRGAEPFQVECRRRGLSIAHVERAPFDNGSVCHTVDLYELGVSD